MRQQMSPRDGPNSNRSLRRHPDCFFSFCRVCSTAATRERVEDIQGQQNTHLHNREEGKLLTDGAKELLFKCVVFQDFLFKVMVTAYNQESASV